MRSSDILEDLDNEPEGKIPAGSLKRKAAKYLGKKPGDKLDISEIRTIEAKAKKMKKSKKKAERNISHILTKHLQTNGS